MISHGPPCYVVHRDSQGSYQRRCVVGRSLHLYETQNRVFMAPVIVGSMARSKGGLGMVIGSFVSGTKSSLFFPAWILLSSVTLTLVCKEFSRRRRRRRRRGSCISYRGFHFQTLDSHQLWHFYFALKGFKTGTKALCFGRSLKPLLPYLWWIPTLDVTVVLTLSY